ncbi:hypothetical protein C7445_102314 [Alicyclobacillus sacchari]|uniref:Uncharacterized protein n=1 Tax=Alicyclobacillus sacchari TaxID=392010 RepID=A0A4R8LSV9_9BACL|nr:hypothetical protein [Alicyclobacillus sacchari]TDY50753.1 hypothetical protein C7445_102314 [Alicyclobacillus sacchari]GMA55754.1 hypothetical protein GCM10025858_02570 [Alicyclobacillus sacchari]
MQVSLYDLAPLVAALGLWPPIAPGMMRLLYRIVAFATLAQVTILRGCIPELSVYVVVLALVIIRGIQEMKEQQHVSWYGVVLGVIAGSLAWEWQRFVPFARPFGLSDSCFAAICTALFVGFLADMDEAIWTWSVAFVAMNLLCLAFGEGPNLIFTFWAVEAGLQGCIVIRRQVFANRAQKFNSGG